MYTTRNAPPPARDQEIVATEQAVFDEFAKYVHLRSDDAIGQYAYARYSHDNWYNQSTMQAVKSVMDLMAARSVSQRVPAISLLSECVRAVYVAITTAMVRNDVHFYNSLPLSERNKIEIDYKYADTVAYEIEAWERSATQSTFSPANQPNAGGVRSSIYSRLPNGAAPTGPLPKSVHVDKETTYVPQRRGGYASMENQQPQEPAPKSAYLGNRGGSVQVSAPKPTQAVKEVAPEPTKQKQPNKLHYAFNPLSHNSKGEHMDYNDHRPHQTIFPQLSTSADLNHADPLRVAAGGLVFDPLSILPTDGSDQSELNVPDLTGRVIHFGSPVLASSMAHAELTIIAKLLQDGVSVDGLPFCYEYRDFTPIHIWPTSEAATIATSGTPLQQLNSVTNITELHEAIAQLKEIPGTCQQVANLLNRRATEFVNEFMAYSLGLQGWVTDDFFGDWTQIQAALESEFSEDLEYLNNAIVTAMPAMVARTSGSVFLDFDVDVAAMLNKWAGITSPTLRTRTLMLSDTHAVIRLPMEAKDLGFDSSALPAILTPLRGCELLYEAIAQFLGRLNDDVSTYRTITICTTDGAHIRIRGAELAVAPTDERRSIIVTSIIRN